jgi:hypothetical protein
MMYPALTHNQLVEMGQLIQLGMAPTDREALYCGKDNTIITWLGTIVGHYEIVSRRRVNSAWSTERYAIRARVKGRLYHGRTFGEGMFVSLKAYKG